MGSPLSPLPRSPRQAVTPRNQILGSEFAGEVEAIGSAATRFKQGDQVFGYVGQSMGAYAEYVGLPEDGAVIINPINLTCEEAVVISYGAIMALSLLRKANIQPGPKVLINGASGGIGSAAVQLAQHFGAEVTGVCSTPLLEFVKSLGADYVIDYIRENFTHNGETYDLIFDIPGKSSFSCYQKSLTPFGILFFACFKLERLFQMLWTSRNGSQEVICAIAPGSREDLLTVKELVEAGKIKALNDKRYPLEQTAEAHRYIEQGHKQGNVVIRFQI